MKKFIVLLLCCAMLFTSCTGKKIYTFFNHNIYWGISQNKADEILSEKYNTTNSGKTITYLLSKDEDFLKPDELVAAIPEIELTFENDKLVKIEQSYHYNTSLPESMGELFNTYLYIALGVEEEELYEADGSEIHSMQLAVYYIENEEVTIAVHYLPDMTDISVCFEPKS